MLHYATIVAQRNPEPIQQSTAVMAQQALARPRCKEGTYAYHRDFA